jgi:CO/xanthine dehydrogenase Mo-binding subunit
MDIDRAAELLGMTPDEVERIVLTDDGEASNPADH